MKKCAVIGNPVSQSLSPAMHNAAYAASGIASEYHFTAEEVPPAFLEKFLHIARNNYHSLAVTMPHKCAIIKYLDALDSTAEKIGAVNTVLNIGGSLKGYNTDCPGALRSLRRQTGVKGQKVIVIGSGGTARAIIFALIQEGAGVTVMGRNDNAVRAIVRDFGCNSITWEQSDGAIDAEIIIKTTPTVTDGGQVPRCLKQLTGNQLLFDVNYGSGATKLQKEAEKRGAIVIGGLELLLNQGIIQFELMTGVKAPEEIMRRAIGLA